MLRAEIVKELRQMFVDGAAPSRLMAHIQLHHPDVDDVHFLIKEYFQEAFKLPLVRHVSKDDYAEPNLNYDHLSRDLVHEIVCRIDQWNTGSLEGSWLEDFHGLSKSSLEEHEERLKAARFQELDRVWNDMTDEERVFIIRRIAHKDYLWYKVKTLSRLVEKLQQKIVELEGHVELESK